jgi:hypothetical protein
VSDYGNPPHPGYGGGNPAPPPSSGSGWASPTPSPSSQPPRFDPPPHPGYGGGYQQPPAPMPAYQPAPAPVHAPAYAVANYGLQPPPVLAQPGGAAVRVEAVEGTPYGVAYPAVPPTPSGPAIGSMVAGIGITGSGEGWGVAVSGAFVVLAGFIGAGSLGMGFFALRQIRRSGGAVGGRGLAIAGISCGGAGIGLTVLLFLLAIVFTAGSTPQ